MKTKICISLLFSLLIFFNMQAAAANNNETLSSAEIEKAVQQSLAIWNAACDATGTPAADQGRQEISTAFSHCSPDNQEINGTKSNKQAITKATTAARPAQKRRAHSCS